MEWQSTTPYPILELRHHQMDEMVDAVARLHQASHVRPSALLEQRFAHEMPLYQNAHCGLEVGDAGKNRYWRIITC